MTPRTLTTYLIVTALIILGVLTTPQTTKALAGEPTAQEGDGEGEAKPPKQEDSEPDTKKSSYDEATREAIKNLFPGAEVEFGEGDVVSLTYKFEANAEDSNGDDFVPSVSRDPKHMRWSRGYEGYRTSFDYGLVVNKFGRWIHKGVWKEVEASIEWGHLSEYMKPADICAVVYTWKNGKKMIGSNWGHACVKLSKSIKLSAKPIPATVPTPMRVDSKRNFGLKYSKGILSSLIKGRVTSKTSKPTFIRGIEPGRVGIVWNGQWVKGIIQDFTMKGVLDPAWVEKETGMSSK